MKAIKSIIAIFKRPSAQVLILQEIEEAKVSPLEALTGRDYAQEMVTYHNDRLKRLKSMQEIGDV